MPLILDNRPIPIWLKSDEDKSPRPTFFYRPLTSGDMIAVAGVYDKLKDAKNGPEAIRILVGMATNGMTGWENMGREFDADGLADLLTFSELKELIELRLAASSLSEADRKNSGSPSPSATSGSANAKGAAGKKKNRQRNRPSSTPGNHARIAAAVAAGNANTGATG